MKRFLMFLVIAIAVVSLGLTIYYFSTDNEVIYIKSSYLVIDKYDNIRTIDGNNELVDFKNRSEHTTLSYTLEQEDDVLEYSEADGYFTALKGGESKIIISTNNRSYSRLVVDVLVCDGSTSYPYIIKSEEDLKKVGNDEKYTSSSSVKLGNDIELTQPWTPIPSYSGTFDGNYFTISNMSIENATTNAGFISTLESTGVLKNLILANTNITADVENIGSFVGTNKGLVQTSEVINGNITAGSSKPSYIGGVVGLNDTETSTAKIDRCGFDGSISLKRNDQVAGGVAGLNDAATISETYARLVVANENGKFGGIVGKNYGKAIGTANIYDSYFYLKENTSTTNFEKIGGIVYENLESTPNNMITGNYYGGDFTEARVKQVMTGSDFKSKTNGYLTSVLNETQQVDFVNSDKFITTRTTSGEVSRIWNFESVWEITGEYPILNIYSSVGSTYVIEFPDVQTTNQITNAQEFYDALASKTGEYVITKDFSIDANAENQNGFTWGDEEHPIPETFDGAIINTDNHVIRNITINNTKEGGLVGLVKTLGPSARIKDVNINTVTITGNKASYVGVLAGESNGALIQGVKIEDVYANIDGEAFGALVGRANDVTGHGIKDITIRDVDGENSYYKYAGGMVGINLTTITAEKGDYNSISDIHLVANQFGGAVGVNGGKIYYTSALDTNFLNKYDESHTKERSEAITQLYESNLPIFIGGVIGTSQFTDADGSVYKGDISDVYALLHVEAETSYAYKLYIGGVAGYNNGHVVRAYVKNTTIDVYGSHSVFAGGIAGYNSGRISNSVVDSNSKIITSITASVGVSGSNNNYILNTDNCSIVGGLVGYDAQTSNSTYSIYECASLMKEITGYYAGGLTGISFGKIEKSYCGNNDIYNGGVTIKGYMAGGISGVIAGGFVKSCYSVCALNSAPYGGKYVGIISAIKMDVSCMGGIAVFVLNKNTVVESCYVVTSFSGNGVSFGSSADLTGYVCGTVKNCAYQNEGSQATPNGTKVSAKNLQGADGFYAFKKAIGSTELWDIAGSYYPNLVGVDNRFPGQYPPGN